MIFNAIIKHAMPKLLTIAPVVAAGGLAALGSIGGSLLGGYFGNKASDKAAAQAAEQRRLAMEQLAQLQGIDLPDLQYNPEMMDYLAGATPIQYDTPQDIQGNMVADSPETRAMQLQALQEMQQRADEGMTAQERYNFMRNRNQAETAARGREQAIIENMQARGMGGSGMEAAMRMIGSQSEMDRLAESNALQAAENARMRAGATESMGSMAGNMRGQDIGLNKSNADILNQLAWNNSQRKMEIANRNIDLQNQSLQDETAEKRKINAANVGTRNEAQLMQGQHAINQARASQESEREKQKAMAGAQLGSIPDIYAKGAADSSMYQNLGTSLGQVPGALINSYNTYQKNQIDKEKLKNPYGGN